MPTLSTAAVIRTSAKSIKNCARKIGIGSQIVTIARERYRENLEENRRKNAAKARAFHRRRVGYINHLAEPKTIKQTMVRVNFLWWEKKGGFDTGLEYVEAQRAHDQWLESIDQEVDFDVL